jgi:hypothetical protein
MPAHFESLRNRLLRGGVAPRHVTRYLTELTEHLDDLIAEEEHAGLDHNAAERCALTRLGDTDSLAETMIARKEFLSWSHRAPWAVFFLGPLAALLAINFASLLLLLFIVEFFGSGSDRIPTLVPAWFNPVCTAITQFDLFILPLLLGWAISLLAVRQKMKIFWPIVGLAIVSIFCGIQTFDIQWSTVPNGLNGVGVSWPFVPHGSRITVATAFRVFVNLGLTVTLLMLWRSRRPHHE